MTLATVLATWSWLPFWCGVLMGSVVTLALVVIWALSTGDDYSPRF